MRSSSIIAKLLLLPVIGSLAVPISLPEGHAAPNDLEKGLARPPSYAAPTAMEEAVPERRSASSTGDMERGLAKARDVTAAEDVERGLTEPKAIASAHEFEHSLSRSRNAEDGLPEAGLAQRSTATNAEVEEGAGLMER